MTGLEMIPCHRNSKSKVQVQVQDVSIRFSQNWSSLEHFKLRAKQFLQN